MTQKRKNPNRKKLSAELFEELGPDARTTDEAGACQIDSDLCYPILLNNPDLIILQDREGKFMFVGPQSLDILGYTVNEMLELDFLKNVYDEDKELVQRAWAESFDSNKTVIIEYRFIDREGELLWLSHRISTLTVNGNLAYIQNNIRNISIQKQFEDTLLEVDNRLTENNSIMRKKNIALEELLIQVENQKSKINENFRANLLALVIPLLHELLNRASQRDQQILELILRNLDSISSAFGKHISDKMYSLSSRELEICNMIREGLSSKNISNLLNIELATVTTHRNNIRKKLGLRNSSTNLMTYLKSL